MSKEQINIEDVVLWTRVERRRSEYYPYTDFKASYDDILGNHLGMAFYGDKEEPIDQKFSRGICMLVNLCGSHILDVINQEWLTHIPEDVLACLRRFPEIAENHEDLVCMCSINKPNS
jgi:hypothetical protein